MIDVLIKREDLNVDTYTEECHVKMQVEVGDTFTSQRMSKIVSKLPEASRET